LLTLRAAKNRAQAIPGPLHLTMQRAFCCVSDNFLLRRALPKVERAFLNYNSVFA